MVDFNALHHDVYGEHVFRHTVGVIFHDAK
ncbi:MAG: hypothetical protein K2Y23_27425 [Cyanobacteria bacterium]|nr:hypothetical protein [Cyanobacteriota bacterium]